MSDDKSDEEESISKNLTLYSENICFVIFRLWNKREEHINTDYAVTSWMLCVIPHIREDVFKNAQNKHHIQVNNVIKNLLQKVSIVPCNSFSVDPANKLLISVFT